MPPAFSQNRKAFSVFHNRFPVIAIISKSAQAFKCQIKTPDLQARHGVISTVVSKVYDPSSLLILVNISYTDNYINKLKSYAY
ncbi:MAG: hypothetical protein DSY90_05415 [Deltaproteobacteria bacterium]|nr:MAG: hypothetical protein DSY90_05415 [Deltaproteobacteria bacterium]